MKTAAAPFVIGALCRRGHNHAGSGGSLRYKSGHCIECYKIRRSIQMERDPGIAMRDIARRKRYRAEKRDVLAARDKAYKLANKELLRAKARAAYWANHDESLRRGALSRERHRVEMRVRQREHKRRLRAERADEVRQYMRGYYRTNNIRIRLRNRINKAIRYGGHKKCASLCDLGFDVEKIMRAMGPCPGTPSDYEIDHIRPLASFNLSDPDQVRMAFAPENHQWLLRHLNRQKAAKYA